MANLDIYISKSHLFLVSLIISEQVPIATPIFFDDHAYTKDVIMQSLYCSVTVIQFFLCIKVELILTIGSDGYIQDIKAYLMNLQTGSKNEFMYMLVDVTEL